MPVGNRLAQHVVPNAHRVLRADGTLSPELRWVDPTTATDPLDLRCNLWRQAAENAAESLTKGSRATVQGQLKQRPMRPARARSAP